MMTAFSHEDGEHRGDCPVSQQRPSLKSLTKMSDFLSWDLTCASVRPSGTLPLVSEALTMDVIMGVSSSEHVP